MSCLCTLYFVIEKLSNLSDLFVNIWTIKYSMFILFVVFVYSHSWVLMTIDTDQIYIAA